MLKIKLIMAALLAIGFAGQTFADDEPAVKPAAKAAKKPAIAAAAGAKGASGDVNTLPTPKPTKWTAAQCATNCTKAKCKGLPADADETATPTPAQSKAGMVAGLACALNCKAPDKAATMVDCITPLYAAKCLNIKAAVAATGKVNRISNCDLLSEGISAYVVGGAYLPRDNEAKPEAAAAWAALKALDTSASAPAADAS